jgi:hypothetical protein
MYNTRSLPNFYWTDRERFLEFIWNGEKIKLADIQRMFHVLEERLIEVYKKELTFGTGLRLPLEPIGVKDSLSNRSLGYSCISDTRNGFDRFQCSLLKRLLSDKKLASDFIDFSYNPPMWRVSRIHKYIDDYTKFHLLALTETELNTGGPSRLTELAALAIENTRTRPVRGVYVFDNKLGYLVQYTKNSSKQGKDKFLPHAFGGVLSDLILQDLILVRPFVRFLLQLVYPRNEDVELYRTMLFVNKGKLFTTEDISDLLAELSQQILKVRITVNPWRHIIRWVIFSSH